jgi:hypothetical protein
MIKRAALYFFVVFSCVAAVAVGSAQAPSAPPAPPAAPAGPPAPCGPGVKDKNVAPASRCFELRSYTIRPDSPGSIDTLHTRFREHTLRLFKKHGMEVVGFWHATSKPNTLVYILAYKDREARDAAWKAFQTDAEWAKVKGELQVTSAIESVFMNATDYGPIK